MIDKETLVDIQKVTNLLTDDDIKQILKNQELERKIRSLFYEHDIAFKKHKDIDDFKIAQVLNTLIKDTHTLIVEESEEKFKTHTKDQEVDI